MTLEEKFCRLPFGLSLESIGWHLVHLSENSARIFKQSEYADLIGVCSIKKEGVFYTGQFAIRDFDGKYILKCRQKEMAETESEALIWVTRCCSGLGEAYLSGQTNIKKIRDVFNKYKKLDAEKPDDDSEKLNFFTGIYLMKLN